MRRLVAILLFVAVCGGSVEAAPAGPPFGSFDTPLVGGTGLQGAIGVTGWALDDSGISVVQLWRDPVNGDPPPAPNGLIFIGNATLVRGARPDVQGLYSNYPDADKAAWGYMLLTNLLPNVGTGAPAGGVGSFTLRVYLYGIDNGVTILSRTFSCDNASGANKPFGTIDTPGQGETVSGVINNFGWVLTPLPGTMPVDGSTIRLFIDSAPLGTATYNGPRSDLATLFPGYNNTNGPVGLFSIDTTILTNGIHTIAWSATDDLSRADGIGSRYFIVEGGQGTPTPTNTSVPTATVPATPTSTPTATATARARPTSTATAAPTPTSGNTCSPQGNATAICNDNATSMSQNCSGTCSGHGGVKCWICPGVLCPCAG